MSTARNIIFGIVVAALIACPLAHRVIGESSFWFDMPEKSELESRNLTMLDDMKKTSFIDKSLQDQAEQFFSDSTPERDSVMMLSAWLQRLGISTASVPFGFRQYHTFYGSEFVADTSAGMILPMPDGLLTSQKAKSRLDALVNTINDAARAHPETRFVVALVTETSQSRANPIYDMVSSYDKLDEGVIQETMVERFEDPVIAFCSGIESSEELQAEWFSDDVHWSIERAAKTYNRIADLLDLKPYVYDHAGEMQIKSAWIGSSARAARDFDYPSQLSDMPYEYPNLKYFRLSAKGEKGKKRAMGFRERLFSQKVTLDTIPTNNSYTRYYGGAPAYVENEGPNNGKTCLVVGDSLTHNLKRAIADNYQTTLFVLPGNEKTERSLESFIQQYRFDDVIMLTQTQKYDQIGERSPKFVGL